MKRDYRGAYEARLPAILREPRWAEVWRPLRGDFTLFAPARGESATIVGAPPPTVVLKTDLGGSRPRVEDRYRGP